IDVVAPLPTGDVISPPDESAHQSLVLVVRRIQKMGQKGLFNHIIRNNAKRVSHLAWRNYEFGKSDYTLDTILLKDFRNRRFSPRVESLSLLFPIAILLVEIKVTISKKMLIQVEWVCRGELFGNILNAGNQLVRQCPLCI